MSKGQVGAAAFASVLVLLGLEAASAGAGDRPPNILFVMSDDHAEQAISAYGSTLIQTPSIDRLIRRLAGRADGADAGDDENDADPVDDHIRKLWATGRSAPLILDHEEQS